MDIAAIAQELGTVAAQANVTVYTMLPEAPDYPCIVINPPDQISYAVTLGGMCLLNFPITVYASSYNTSSAWTLLYALLSFNVPDPAPVSLVDALVNYSVFEHFNQALIKDAMNFRLIGDNITSAEISIEIRSVNYN